MFNVTLHRPGEKGNGGALWAPAVDIIDEKDDIRVRADLPGMKKEDIEVSVNNDTLSIKGEKKEEKEIKEKDYVRSERYYGAFQRSFTLPAGVDPQKVNAAYKDGVLEITLPKREDAKPKQIKVDIK
ncbi:MAG: Hsp20/alpha crystallin family protein [Candidatus Omnitrophica bacterium]|nr:Hsp20/alpha crystallin family protein [Candidatus Omnitrophota bacterium]